VADLAVCIGAGKLAKVGKTGLSPNSIWTQTAKRVDPAESKKSSAAGMNGSAQNLSREMREYQRIIQKSVRIRVHLPRGRCRGFVAPA